MKLKEQGSGSKGVNDTHMRNFFFLFFLAIGIWVFRLRFRHWGWDLGPMAGIWVLELVFGYWSWDLGLETETLV